MNVRQMNRLTAHMDRYLGQECEGVLHPVIDNGYHVDVLVYRPSEKNPFWKLVTMGASDYLMPPLTPTLGRRNEYIMTVDGEEKLDDAEVRDWFVHKLLGIVFYAYSQGVHLSYGHSLEWKNEDDGDEMVGAFLEMPQFIPDAGVLHCRLGLLRRTTLLQAVLLTRSDLDRLAEIGPAAFSELLYPEEEGAPRHFLSERRRSERF